MELSPYKYNFKTISNNLTNFEQQLLNLEQVRYIENPSEFYKETAYQKEVDGKLSYYYLFSTIKSNNFNEGSGYLTHGFDFYRGSFHGQMIRGLINYCNLKEGSVILDPFCGSGTVLIESKVLGFNSIGIDINPIACLNSTIKTQIMDYPLSKLISDNKKYFDLAYYKQFENNNEKSFISILNSDLKTLFYIFLYTRAVSMNARFSSNKKESFNLNYNRIIKTLKSFENLKKQIEIKFGNAKIIFNDSFEILKILNSNSMDAIITSPPYIDLIDYIQEDIVQIQNLFNYNEILNLKEKSIGNRYKDFKITEELFWKKIYNVLNQLYRILKPENNCILIIGGNRNMKKIFEEYIIQLGFIVERILLRGVVNIKKKNNSEYVFFLKK